MLGINKVSFDNHKQISYPNIIPSEKTKKIRIIYSMLKSKEKEKIKDVINEFNLKNKMDYFHSEPNIIVGKTPKGPLFNDKQEVIPTSYVGPSNLFHNFKKRDPSHHPTKNGELSRSYESISIEDNSRKNYRKYTKKTSISVTKSNAINNIYKLIDDKSLQKIYEKIKVRIDGKNKKIRRSLFKNINNSYSRNQSIFDYFNKSREMPNNLKDNLFFQEKVLLKKELLRRSQDTIQKTLSIKCKRNEDELLMNTPDDILIKTLKNKQKEKNMGLADKYKENSWNVTLRTENNKNYFDKVGFENVGDKINPCYTLFNLQSETEFFNKPLSQRYKTQKFKKNYEKGINNKIDVFGKTLNDLEIKGKKLLDVESMRESGFKGKKIMYKNGEVDLLFYQKLYHLTSTPAEIKKNICNERIFAKDYPKKCV